MDNNEEKDEKFEILELGSKHLNNDYTLRQGREMAEGIVIEDDFETKVSFVGQLKFQQGQFVTTDEAYEVIVHVGDVIDYVRMDRNEVYKEMARLQVSMNSRVYTFIDTITGRTRTRSLVIGTDYKNGDFKIQYHKGMKNILLAEKDFVPLQIETFKRLQKTSSCNLYKQLKVKYYRKSDRCIRDGRFVKRMSIEELRVRLGTVEITPVMQKELDEAIVEWAAIIRKSPSVSNKVYNDFKRRVFIPTLEEILSESEFDELTYEEIKGGRGGRVCAIEFSWHDPFLDETSDSDGKRMNEVVTVVEGSGQTLSVKTHIKEGKELIVYGKCVEIFDKLKKKDGGVLVDISFAQILCEECGCDMNVLQKVRDLYESTDRAKIRDERAWLRACIRERWYDNKKDTATNYGGSAGAFGRFQQRDIDFDELEKKIWINNPTTEENDSSKKSSSRTGGGSAGNFGKYKQREYDFEALEEKLFGNTKKSAKVNNIEDSNDYSDNEGKNEIIGDVAFREVNEEQGDIDEMSLYFENEVYYEKLPDSRIRRVGMVGGKEVSSDILSVEDAIESCQLTDGMLEDVKRHFGIEHTDRDYSDIYEFTDRIGVDAPGKSEIEFWSQALNVSKRHSDIIEYSIGKTEEILKYDDRNSEIFMTAALSEIKRVIKYAFESIK